MKTLILIFFLGCRSLFAAASLTHLFIAEQFLKQAAPVTKIEERDFYLGNVFPDIQYLGNVSRDSTHELGLSIEDILYSSSPFRAGMRLHSFVDEQRENLVIKWKIYDRLEEVEPKHRPTFLKLIESEILYDQTDVLYFTPFFSEISEDEIYYGIPVKTHQKSHQFILEHLYHRPSEILQNLAKENASFFSFSAATVQLWSHLIPRLAQEESFNNYVRDLIGFFSLEFAKHSLAVPLQNPIKILSSEETDIYWISLIENSEGKRSIVKQSKNELPEEQIHNVVLIPPGVPFPGKIFLNRPATLESIVP